MRFVPRPALTAAVILAVLASTAVGSLGQASAATAGSASSVASSAPSTATPAPSSSSGTLGSSSLAVANADPTMSEMNATHDHTMGSTIPGSDPAAAAGATVDPATGTATAAPHALNAAAATVPPGTLGLDVSGWQTLTAANWTQIYAEGARFVYVKATEGTTYTSSQFSEQYTDSYNAGLIHGAYHFATPNTSSGAAQANFFIANGGGWSNDGKTLPPLLDIEYNPYGATCYGLTQAQMVSWISDFSSTMLAKTGRLPAIYSTTDWWSTCTGNSNAFSANPLFIARYPSSISQGAGTLPAGWSSYALWQYADSGTFPGDQDVFNGNLTQLQSFARNSTVATTPVVTALTSPIIGVGDFNGDGKPDLIARRPDGTLWFYAGTGTVGSGGEGYKPAVEIGRSGWNAYSTIIGVGDFNGDGKTDLIAAKPDGTLWFYAGTGVVNSTNDGYLPAVQIGTGWNIYNDIVAVGDFNGDGKPDLIARKPDGTLWFYAGTGTVGSGSEGYQPAVEIGTSGWNAYTQILGVGDINGDGHPDLIAMRNDGSLWFYAGTGLTTGSSAWYKPAQSISIPGIVASDTLTAPGDFNGDGHPDLIARTTSGALQFYGGTTLHQEGYQPAVKIGNGGWNAYSQVIAVGDFNGDGKPDLLAVRPDGTLWFYAGTGTAGKTEGYLPAQKIGNGGWNAYTKIVGVGDFTGNGKNDLIAVRSDGSLWFYAGTGVVNATNDGYAPAKKIGNDGWGAYTNLMAGDFNGDGKPDLVGTRADGSLWFYSGNQTTTGATPYFASGVKVGTSGWNAYTSVVSTGDANGDGNADLVATKPNGTLWFYAGNGKMSATNEGYAPAVETGADGWNAYATIIGPGDFNGDKLNDLLGIRSDGTLWFYAGTGNSGAAYPSFSAATVIGSGWNIYE